jgi:hypothetical protein
MSSDSNSPDKLTFDGSNWQDLTRLITSARVKFLQSDLATAGDEVDPYGDDRAKSAYLISRLSGPALDWAGQVYETTPAVINNYAGFLEALRNAFGVSDAGLSAQRRGQLEGLKWQSDLPIFFSEFDRLTQLLGLTGDATRIALVRGKLPVHVQKLLAEQALDFANYDTMRERLLTMWALDPGRSITGGTSSHGGSSQKRPRCGRCGKKGHTASDCRSKN